MVELSLKRRNQLGLVTMFLCLILSVCSFGLIGLGNRVQYYINERILLLNDYSGGTIPIFLITMGVILFLINATAVKISYDCREPETRDRFQYVFFGYLAVMFITIWVVLAAAIVCYVHVGKIEDALHSGLKMAMSRYKKDLTVKVMIDKIQFKTKCCGSRSYKDWFKTSWIHTDYVNTNSTLVSEYITKGEVFLDNVPFSCCNVSVLRPCIHHFVDDPTKHTEHSVTVYKIGCTSTFITSMKNHALFPSGAYCLSMFFFQIVALILLRFLQTSVETAILSGDPEGIGIATFCAVPDDATELLKRFKKNKAKHVIKDSDTDDEVFLQDEEAPYQNDIQGGPDGRMHGYKMEKAYRDDIGSKHDHGYSNGGHDYKDKGHYERDYDYKRDRSYGGDLEMRRHGRSSERDRLVSRDRSHRHSRHRNHRSHHHHHHSRKRRW